jgi:hypothetical protein
MQDVLTAWKEYINDVCNNMPCEHFKAGFKAGAEATTHRQERSSACSSLLECRLLVEVKCPSCGFSMIYKYPNVLSCYNEDCKIYGTHWKEPTIKLEAL